MADNDINPLGEHDKTEEVRGSKSYMGTRMISITRNIICRENSRTQAHQFLH